MFISIEGIDGSGKTTQASLLYEKLNQMGYDSVLVHEPGNTKLGLSIRNLILSDNKKSINPYSELFLFLADRAQHYEEVIKPCLQKDKIIICDRFIDTTIAYQGFGRGIEINIINQLHNTITDNLIPTKTFLIAIHPNDSFNSERNKDRIEKENLFFHEKIYNGFLMQAKKYPNRVSVINGKQSIKSIHSLILDSTLSVANINVSCNLTRVAA